ncbi:hypothetical protein [Desulfovibrio sp. UCD-KL4C]|uniref:hypothetical protein n=1 Tax=Desulfovibrio sp. UCD-KL4C TaxID=2578120 RepID=UPI0025C5522E|nr:hypothetical protein [Desulfovibrio sp. UCD-KL4C]
MPVGSQNIFAVSGLIRFRAQQQNEMENSLTAVFSFYLLWFIFLFISTLSSYAFLKNICRSFPPNAVLVKRSFLHIKSSLQHIQSKKSFHLIPSLNNSTFPNRLSLSNYRILPFGEFLILNRFYDSLSGKNISSFQSI